MENVFNEILELSIDSIWLLVAVIIVRLLLYRAPKYFRKILWGLVGLKLLIPFSFKSSLSLAPEISTEAVNRVSQQVVAPTNEQGFSLISILSVVWLVVVIAFLGYGIISYLKLKFKIFDSIIYRENIYYSEKIESPFVCGFIKPKIYIPYGLDEETQNCVLLHEKTHIKYADHIIMSVGFIILCVHWFNPLVWVSYFLFCKDIELSCDECVVRNFDVDECKKYAKALLALGVNKVKLSACPVAFGEVSIKKRIKSIVNYKKAGKVLVCVSMCLCIVVAVCFMTDPEVRAKEQISEDITVEETTTESVTEITTESTTEPITEPITEPVTEPTTVLETEIATEAYKKVEDASNDYEELVSKNENNIEDLSVARVEISEVFIGEQNKDDSFEYPTVNDPTPTLPAIVWDPVATAPAQNYHHTRPYNPHNPNDQFYRW